MFCEHCGAKLADGVLFCEDCGMRVENAPPAQSNSFQAAASPPQPTPPADKKGKTSMVIGIAAGGALLLGVMVFLGIRLLGKEASPGDAPEPPATQEATKPGAVEEGDALNTLPAYTIKTPETPQATPAQAAPVATPKAASAANAPQDGFGTLTELEATLPGIWLSEPDGDGDRSLVFIGLRECGNALAFPEGDANAEPEAFLEAFQVRQFTWSGWRAEGDTFYMVDADGFETAYAAKLISRDEIELACEDEFLSFLHPRLHRVDEASFPPLLWFVEGCWVSEKKDEEGNHIAIQFSMDGDYTCDVWVTRTAEEQPQFGAWSKSKWEHSERVPAEFEITGEFLHIDLANGATLDFSLTVKDAWTMKLWLDSQSDIFRRMDWLPEQ